MGPLEIVGGILLILTSVFLIIVVIMQEHKTGMGVLSGAEQQYTETRNQGKTLNVMLAKLTKIAAVVFFVLTLVMNLLIMYLK